MGYENATSGCLRTILLILAIASWSHVHGQVYFEGLYGDIPSGQGIATDGTLATEGGYLSWSNSYGNLMPYLFRVDAEGVLLHEMFMEQPDSIDCLTQNLIAISDTLFVGVVSIKNHQHPLEIRGDYGLVNFSINGHLSWQFTYGNSDRKEIPQRAIRTSDGGFAMSGQSVSGIDPNDDGEAYLIRIDALGNALWEQNYGGTLYDAASDLIQTLDGGFLILGWTRSFGEGERDFYLVKTDSLGNQQWQRTYGNSGNEGGWSIMRLTNGNYILTGGGSDDGVTSHGRLYEVDPTGEVVWQRNYAMQSGNSLFKTLEMEDGSLVSVGLTTTSGEGNAGWLIKTDSEGIAQWQRKYNKNENTDLFYSLLATEDGGFLLSGQAVNEETNSQDAWLLKVDSVGCAYPNCIVGVDEAEPSKVMVDVWPNPTTDFLNIELQQQGVAEVQLYDMAGKLLFQKQTTQLREVIDVSALESGLYLLSVLQGDMKTTVKVMVW